MVHKLMLLDVLILVCFVVLSRNSDINFNARVSIKKTCSRPPILYNHSDRFLDFSARTRRNTIVALLLLSVDIFTINDYVQNSPLCVSFIIDDTEVPVYVVQLIKLPGPNNKGLLYSSQTSLSLLWRVIQSCADLKRTKYQILTNVTLLKDTVTWEIES